MKNTVFILLATFTLQGFCQMDIKNNEDKVVMRISNTGKVAIGTNLTNDAAETLELREGTLTASRPKCRSWTCPHG